MTGTLRILHLFPRLLGLNGESGNVDILTLRSEWRGLPVEVTRHESFPGIFGSSGPTLLMIGSTVLVYVALRLTLWLKKPAKTDPRAASR